jgi:hypothetical protein
VLLPPQPPGRRRSRHRLQEQGQLVIRRRLHGAAQRAETPPLGQQPAEVGRQRACWRRTGSLATGRVVATGGRTPEGIYRTITRKKVLQRVGSNQL